MKKILLFLILSVFGFGQNFELKKTDSLTFIQNSSKLISETGKEFKKVEEGKYNDKLYFKYKNSSDESEEFYIFYVVRNEGENKDLEIKGIKQWSIDSILGKYLTIYNFYKKNYNSKADIEKIQKMGQDWNAPQESAKIRKTSIDGLWEIRFW